MSENLVFLLFTNCKVVTGAKRSIICDLQRGEFDFIPNDLTEILTIHKDKTLMEIKNSYHSESEREIEAYFDFLLSKEYGFWGEREDRSLFPDIDLTWCSPSVITNSIIDVDETSNYNFEKIFTELEELGCRDVQIRFYSETDAAFIEELLSMLTYSRIKSVELIMKNNLSFAFEVVEHLTARHPRIRNVIIHSSPEFKLAKINKVNGRGNIIYVTDVIDSASHCGIIHHTNFVVNLPTFMESQQYNSCLNGKISIDVHGNIKNCPSMSENFGNIQEVSLKEVSLNDTFKKVWSIHKEQIEICKDCEFRHICTDCRAYLKDPGDIHSKPLKCNYNPYTAQWTN
jgi:SPASM domain peptide maturase of grasp-with-spasm system